MYLSQYKHPLLRSIHEVLLCQPLPLLVRLRNVDTLDFEDDRPCAVIAAGNHNPVVGGSALHDGTTLQNCINLATDGLSLQKHVKRLFLLEEQQLVLLLVSE